MHKRHYLLEAAALAMVALSLWALARASSGLDIERMRVDEIPATVFRAHAATASPVIVIAHGFAGSQQLMQPLAETLARNGYIAVTFDFAGHGRNAAPLKGGLADLDKSTRALLDEIGRVVSFARALPGSNGRLALIGHSMASELVVQYAMQNPGVDAVAALSLFGREVTPARPRNLLVVDGAWEPRQLREAGLRIIAAAAPGAARQRVTYGDIAHGTGRRFVLADGAEHIGVIYSRDALAETLGWMNAVFGRSESGYLDRRGKWLALLFLGLAVLARPVAQALPTLSPAPRGANLPWRRLAPLCLGPAVLTPVLLWPLPTGFLPILLGDYLAVHFALYGLLTLAGLRWTGALSGAILPRARLAPILTAAGALALYHIVVIGFPIDAYVTSFAPTGWRWALMLPIFAGVAIYFLADEWLTRGDRPAPGGYVFSKICFVISLAIAVGLNPGRLFFLIIIVPVMVLLFTFYGIVNFWTYRRTREPSVGALGSAMSLAWAIAVTFPIVV